MPPRPRPSRRPKPLPSSSSPAKEANPTDEVPAFSKIPEPRVTSSESEGKEEGPEHYTYQEMIDHLRKARAGSQSVKSKKKRKRRSHQPVRERRRKRLIITLSTLGVVLPLASFTIGSFVFSYLNYKSESFREEASISVSESIGFDGEFDGLFNVSRLSFKNTNFQANGPDDSVLAELKMENLEAQLSLKSLFSDVWDVEHLLVDKTRIHLRPLPAATTTAATKLAPETSPFKLAALGFSGVPQDFNLSKVTLHHLDLFFGSNIDRLHSLEKSHWILSAENDGYSIVSDVGTLRYANWPEMKISRVSLFADQEGKFTIQDRANLTTENGGTCHVTGTIMTGGSDPFVRLNASIIGIKLDDVVPESWRDRIGGLLSGQFALEGALKADEETQLSGALTVPGFSFRNLDFLDKLSIVFGTSRLKRLEFEEFSAKLKRENGTITISDMYARQPDLMIFTGSLTIDPTGNLAGTIEIGLPDSVLNSFTQGNKVPQDLFELRSDNHNWTSISIGGTLEEPTEDLISRLHASQGTPLPARTENTFQRPTPLEDKPAEVYTRHLEDLFKKLTE